MTDRTTGHTIEVTFEAGWGPSSKMVCHHDKADDSRPCWPRDEHGDPYGLVEGEDLGCVYAEWYDNGDGLENLGKPEVTIRFDLASAEWVGDGFTFTLGALVPDES